MEHTIKDSKLKFLSELMAHDISKVVKIQGIERISSVVIQKKEGKKDANERHTS